MIPPCFSNRLSNLLLALTLVAVPLTGTAQQAWPSKAVRFIVPFPPGGSVDAAGRIVAQELSTLLGQPVVVDNVAGAGGNIGVGTVAKSAPDGYTIGIGATGTIAINVSMIDKPPFDPVKDLAPITMLAVVPVVLAAHPSVAARSVNELVALARATPGGLPFASSGTGGALHLAGELFKVMTGAPLTHVPYKGAAPATRDLMGGQVMIGFVDLTSALPQIRSGRLRAIGITGPRRALSAPDIPTIAELGLPGYAAEGWVGLFAPAGTPAEVVALLNKHVVQVLSREDVRQKMLASAIEPAATTPGEFARFIQEEIPKWAKALKASGIHP